MMKSLVPISTRRYLTLALILTLDSHEIMQERELTEIVEDGIDNNNDADDADALDEETDDLDGVDEENIAWQKGTQQ